MKLCSLKLVVNIIIQIKLMTR